jgi:hypothetical protein
MRIIAFIEDYAVIDKIIRYLKLTFATERPPPPHTKPQLTIVAEERVEYLKKDTDKEKAAKNSSKFN